jgi:RND superfamily putative drug exporter
VELQISINALIKQESANMANGKGNVFGKIGRLITKRRYAIIGVWILLLAIILPIVLTATGVTSLAMESSTNPNLESAKANDIITAQFQKTVANDSLIIIISTHDASSLDTQRFIDELTRAIEKNPEITGIENITSVYSILIPALNQTNQGIYAAYNGGNLTYNLLYSVPTIYSNVWYAAYNETRNGQLIPGLNQTNQAVYVIFDNANMTYSFLYGLPATYYSVWANAYSQSHDQLVAGYSQANQGVYLALDNANLTVNLLYGGPAMYLNVWQQVYGATSDANYANQEAYTQTDAYLQAVDPQAYIQYTGPLLTYFDSVWVASSITDPLQRAVDASTQTTQYYLSTISDPAQQAFITALTSALPFQDFIANTQEQNNAVLTNFAIQTVVAQSGGASTPEFVTAAYNLGPNPSSAALESLVISTLNEIAYENTQTLLAPMVPPEYAQYVTPLLDGFNATWAGTFQDPSTQALPPDVRASLAANITIQGYIDTALAGNSTMQDFVSALSRTFSLDTFLSNSQDQNNAQLQAFSIQYIANQSKSPAAFVQAAWDLTRTPSTYDLQYLADSIIWYSQNYGMDNFIPLFNQIAYEQTEDILKGIDEASFNDYTSHLLNLFNASWAARVPSQPMMSPAWINQTASAAADAANAQFIPAYLGDGKDLASQIASSLKLQDYLKANTTDTNSKLRVAAINYVADQSGLSHELIAAIYDMGENATSNALQTLASHIVSNPDAYNIGEQFNALITSFVSPQKDVTLISITFHESDNANLLAIRGIIAQKMGQNPAGIESAQVTGDDALNYDFGQSTNEDLDLILPVTIALLVIATGLFFRSVVTPIITLGTIGVGLGVSQIFPYLISTYINPVDYTVSTVLLTVLLGVGTDYSIFVIARHREERINGLSVMEAIKKSIVWAGESIVTSGATVIISFLALAGTSMVMMQTMGLVVGLGVIVTLLASLTFAPALTAILGDRIFWPNSGKRFERYAAGIVEKNKRQGGYFAKSGAFSVKHGKAIILIAVLVTVPAFYVYATTVPTYDLLGSASSSLESVSASQTLTESFGGGRLMPTYVVVTFAHPIVDNEGRFNMDAMAALEHISSDIAGGEGIHEVTGPTMPYGEAIDYQTVTNASDAATYSGMLSTIGADNQSALITVKFTVDPYSTEAMNYAQEIRSSLHADYDGTADITGIYVGGTTGGVLDTRTEFQDQFNLILPIVALGVGIVLFIVLGSLILPLFAILSVLMSIVWTLAVTVLVFQATFSYGLLFITPLILFVLLLGLGMDYNIFILTRIREEASKGHRLNHAIVHAVQQTGGIITAAAVILAGSLGALLLSSNMMLREMGFAFAFSILIDALVVRTYLVPAVMSVFGKWNWYNPIKRLQRIKDLDDKKPPAELQDAAEKPE